MERAIIIGSRGAGKSTLANKLSKKTGLPVLYLDKLYWNQDGKSLAITEFDQLLSEELKKDAWIIDGNYIRALDTMLERCDTVVFLDYPKELCLWGVITRALQGKGDIYAEGYSGRLDFSLLKFVWRTAEKNRQRYYAALKDVRDTQVIVLKNRRECKRFLASVEK